MKKMLLNLFLFVVIVSLASCGKEPSKATYGQYHSPYVTASQFVSALNSVDNTSSSELKLDVDQTVRSQQVGQDDWFVIWDSKFSEYKAVSLQYLRSIYYYDYVASNTSLASEYRSIEGKDIMAGRWDGDTFGDDYEVVDRLSSGYYEGRNSGYLYEDEKSSTDVSLIAREQAQLKFYEKAARLSLVYNVSVETSMSMITLGSKIEKVLSRSHNGELTTEDQSALLADMKSLTGASLDEIQNAAENDVVKTDVLNKIAHKIGTTSQNLEQKILPEVFGIVL